MLVVESALVAWNTWSRWSNLQTGLHDNPSRDNVCGLPCLSMGSSPMAIEFPCCQCGEMMRTPSSAGGKKGKCAHCATVQPIPRQSQPAASGNGKIEFDCQKCRQTVRVPAAAAGKKGRCPHCQQVVQIPDKSQPPVLPEQAATHSPTPASGNGKIEFDCQKCRQTVRVPAAAAGKKGRCPHCQQVVQIPAR